MDEGQKKIIDFEQIIRNKAGNRHIPRFLINYLKRILHEDTINDYLNTYPDVQGVDFLRTVLEYLNITLDVHGAENLPEGGLYTFVGNHPLGGPDGVAIGKIIGEHYNGNIRYLVNSFLMALPPLAPLCVPVNIMGAQSRNLSAQVDAIFGSEAHVIMFPAGLCSRKQKGVIKDLVWKKTFVQKSVQYQRDVVPMFFEGRNSNRFYNIANVCKFFGIKFNVAMLFLVDEMLRHRGDTFGVYIGKPIPWQTFDKSRPLIHWAQYVKNIVYGLKPEK